MELKLKFIKILFIFRNVFHLEIIQVKQSMLTRIRTSRNALIRFQILIHKLQTEIKGIISKVRYN